MLSVLFNNNYISISGNYKSLFAAGVRMENYEIIYGNTSENFNKKVNLFKFSDRELFIFVTNTAQRDLINKLLINSLIEKVFISSQKGLKVSNGIDVRDYLLNKNCLGLFDLIHQDVENLKLHPRNANSKDTIVKVSYLTCYHLSKINNKNIENFESVQIRKKYLTCLTSLNLIISESKGEINKNDIASSECLTKIMDQLIECDMLHENNQIISAP